MHGLDTMRRLNKAAEQGENRKMQAGTKKVREENKELKSAIKRLTKEMNRKSQG